MESNFENIRFTFGLIQYYMQKRLTSDSYFPMEIFTYKENDVLEISHLDDDIYNQVTMYINNSLYLEIADAINSQEYAIFNLLQSSLQFCVDSLYLFSSEDFYYNFVAEVQLEKLQQSVEHLTDYFIDFLLFNSIESGEKVSHVSRFLENIKTQRKIIRNT